MGKFPSIYGQPFVKSSTTLILGYKYEDLLGRMNPFKKFNRLLALRHQYVTINYYLCSIIKGKDQNRFNGLDIVTRLCRS